MSYKVTMYIIPHTAAQLLILLNFSVYGSCMTVKTDETYTEVTGCIAVTSILLL